MTIELNAPIPEFSALKATSETEISSGTLTDKFSVLYFYPKDNTSGCTLESQDFSRLHDEFVALNCARCSFKDAKNFSLAASS